MLFLGQLYFDDTPNRTLEQKIVVASGSYVAKFGSAPDVCYVHPGEMNGKQEISVLSIAVRPCDHVMPYYLWMGWLENEGQKEPSSLTAGIVERTIVAD